jgi:hypothetical protein
MAKSGRLIYTPPSTEVQGVPPRKSDNRAERLFRVQQRLEQLRLSHDRVAQTKKKSQAKASLGEGPSPKKHREKVATKPTDIA